jgi:hypothetical protein
MAANGGSLADKTVDMFGTASSWLGMAATTTQAVTGSDEFYFGTNAAENSGKNFLNLLNTGGNTSYTVPENFGLTVASGEEATKLGASASDIGFFTNLKWAGVGLGLVGVGAAVYQAAEQPTAANVGYVGFQGAMVYLGATLAPEIVLPIAAADVLVQHYNYNGSTGWTAVGNHYNDAIGPQGIQAISDVHTTGASL